MANPSAVSDLYKDTFGTDFRLFRSPGRINLIGEHTDYNLGLVLPAAIDKAIYIAVGKRTDNTVQLLSADFNYTHSESLDDIKPAWKLWPNYILGVIEEFKKAGKCIAGFNIVFGGDIPLSAGMSSSAAICAGTAFALNTLFNCGYSKLELAKLAVAAEHNYIKVRCGLMDPYVNLFGRKNTLVKLDCKSETHEYIPFDADSIQFVLFNTGVRHNFIKLSAAFDERRMQCKAGLDIIQQLHPEIKILSQANNAMLDSILKSYDEKVYKRCLYVFEESHRVEAVCSALKAGDFNSVGRHLLDGHEGLQNLYEVSCDETDFLVNQVKDLDGVLGARMMGAGFGGCTLNLIKTEAVEEVIAAIRPLYKERFGNGLKIYHTHISDGTSELENN
jgi:galactokinase